MAKPEASGSRGGCGPLPKHVFVVAMSAHNAKQGSAKECGMADLKALSSKGQWEEDFLKVGAPPPDVAFKFGKLVRGKLNHHLAVPFFHRGLQGKPANAPECADQDLGLAVKSGLALPPAEESARLARDIAGERCFGVLESAIVAQLTASGSDSFDAKNICEVLKAKGAL